MIIVIFPLNSIREVHGRAMRVEKSLTAQAQIDWMQQPKWIDALVCTATVRFRDGDFSVAMRLEVLTVNKDRNL